MAPAPAMATEEAEDRRQRMRCELCAAREAAVHCEPDEAWLCWACDARVHAANFLVARHPRALLCRHCRRPTPWRASGPRLAPILSLCLRCCRSSARRTPPLPKPGREGARVEQRAGEIDAEEEDENADDEEDDWDEEEEGDGDNQVVPLSTSSSAVGSPATATSFSLSSSSYDSSYDRVPISNARSLKRTREMESSQYDHSTSSSEPSQPVRNTSGGDDEMSFGWYSRQPKRAAVNSLRPTSPNRLVNSGSATAANSSSPF